MWIGIQRCFVFALLATVFHGNAAYLRAYDFSQLLWYDRPAVQWTEALPIGNGRLGCMVFGDPARAHFQFNEDTLWTGGPHSYAHPRAAKFLPKLRQLLFEDRQKDAEALATREFMSIPLRQCAYQPFGDLWLDFEGNDHANNYRRSLDLQTATATTEYQIKGVRYTRQTIASYPDQAIVIHLVCDRPGGLSFHAKLTSPHSESTAQAIDHATLLLKSKVANMPAGRGTQIKSRLHFAAYARVLSPDAHIESMGDEISLTGGTEATIVLTAATSFVNYRDVSGNAEAASRTQLDRIPSSWQTIQRRHVADYRGLYDRVHFCLTSSANSNLSTDERILRNAKELDPNLAALLFNYGRFLMIASSRPGSQPANLQGVWNDQLTPPWDSR